MGRDRGPVPPPPAPPPSTLTRKVRTDAFRVGVRQPPSPPLLHLHVYTGGVEGGAGAQTRVPVVPAADASARTAERQPGQS